MTPFLASAGLLEFSSSSAVIVSIASLVAGIGAIAGSVRAYFLARKRHLILLREVQRVQEKLLLEHLSSHGQLIVKRKDSDKTVTLPEHYTPAAAQELIDLLTH